MGSHEKLETEPNKNIVLEAEGLRASINPIGAYVESLVSADGSDLLHPRHHNTNGKSRGGMHVCAPNFGSGYKVGLPQHGFGRDLEWETVSVSEDKTDVQLRLMNPAEQVPDLANSPFKNCIMMMNIGLAHEGKKEMLEVVLVVDNGGDVPFTLTPGFHPYFPIDSRKPKIKVTKTARDEYELSDLADARGLTEPLNGSILFGNGSHNISIKTINLGVPVIWTDSPDEYVCVEPTRAGAVTADGSQIDHEKFLLPPRKMDAYDMRIEWQPVGHSK